MDIKRLDIRRQFQDVWKIGFYIFLILVIIFIYLFSTRSYTFQGVLFGGIFGVFGHLRATWISSTIIPFKNKTAKEIKDWFVSIHYDNKEDNILVPMFPRLLRFNAQNIFLKERIRQSDKDTMVIGPYYVLKQLKRHLSSDNY